MSNTADLEATVGALLALERQRRRSRRRWLAAAGVLVVPALIAARSVPRTIEAERFVLRATSGPERAVWSLREDGAAEIALRDPQGRERLTLAVAGDGRPTIDLRDAEGLLRVRLLLSRESSLNFYDRAAHLRAGLGVTSYGPTPIRPYGENARAIPEADFFGFGSRPGAPPAQAVSPNQNDGPVFKMYDANGKPRLEARVDGDLPIIFMHTPQGTIQRVSTERKSDAVE